MQQEEETRIFWAFQFFLDKHQRVSPTNLLSEIKAKIMLPENKYDKNDKYKVKSEGKMNALKKNN